MSKTLRELRIEKGLTLAELAAALGCALSGPGAWERGRYGPSPKQIPRLAVALGITPEEARKATEESRGQARAARQAMAHAAGEPAMQVELARCVPGD
jgi:transcriptional regulator with XRE-family HTH domain